MPRRKIRNPNMRMKESKPSLGLPVPPKRGAELAGVRISAAVFLLPAIF